MAINLLPEQEKRELQIEETGRKLSLIFLFLFIFLLVLILVFLALKIYILSQAKHSQDILKSKEEAFRSSQFQDFKLTIEKTNRNLSKIKNFYDNQISPALILEKLSNLIPQTIYFTSLSFKKNFQKTKSRETSKKEIEVLAEIHISGYAQTRQDLFLFKKDLEEEEEFKDVYFSPSSWVTPNDIEFSLSFIFKK